MTSAEIARQRAEFAVGADRILSRRRGDDIRRESCPVSSLAYVWRLDGRLPWPEPVDATVTKA